jgi:relaxase/mobilisation nuclease domain
MPKFEKGADAMAATRLIPLHVNKGKTIAQSLGDRTDYAKNPEKTEKGELVTGYQCDPMTVDEEFMLSKRQYEQITGRRQKHEVIAYQIRQSFKPGEITPEEANRLGHELALRFTKGKYAFIVATHTDRAHVHNHIVFNSTSIDATRKFKNFWLSSFALQRVSDLICLENGLSVIAPKPYKERTKRTEYPRRVKNRDVLCEDIDLILQKKPESFDAFLQELQQLNYEIKYGKHISVRGKNQTRFIRLSSLEDGYTEADLRAHFLGQREHKPAAKQRSRTNARPFNLVIDIQSKLQSKGVGYQRWASVYNLKQMSKTLLFLRDHKIESMEQLDQMVMQQVAKRDALLTSIQQSEKRLAEIGTLKKHIINYSKTRSTYEEYRKAGYSKKFLEAHREEITLHKAAKAAFDELGVKKIPKVKELSIEYAEVLTAKKQAYAEYHQVKNEAQELLIAQRNIASLYDAERKEEEQKHQKEDQIH